MIRGSSPILFNSPSERVRLLVAALEGSWRPAPPPLRLNEPELSSIVPALAGSGTAGLVWRRLRASGEDSATPAGRELRDAYRQQVLDNARWEREVGEIVGRLRAASIEPVLVKGWAAARSYSDDTLRPWGDIDLLLRPGELERAGAVLAPYSADLIHQEYANLTAARWDELHARTETVPLGGAEIRVLGAEDHLAFLCLHFLREGGWRPLWLCDIAAAVEAAPPSFDWDRCLGVWDRRAGWIAGSLLLAGSLLGADLGAAPQLQARRMPRWLLPAVLKQWERPRTVDRIPPDLLLTSLRRPRQLPAAIAARWPDPMSASIRLSAPFNGVPRLPLQAATLALAAGTFLRRTAPAKQTSREPNS